MQRVLGMDIHRTFAEVVFWEAGRLRPAGRIDMTRSGLEGFGRSLSKEDEVVIEATGNAMAVVRVLGPYVARVIIANPLQVKAIAHAHVKTDKIDAGVLASPRRKTIKLVSSIAIRSYRASNGDASETNRIFEFAAAVRTRSSRVSRWHSAAGLKSCSSICRPAHGMLS